MNTPNPTPAKVSEALYLDIWKALKANRKCKVACHYALHARVIHAVINKKYYDDAFKLEQAEANLWSKLTYICGSSHIDFKLTMHHVNGIKEAVKRVTLEDI